MVTVAIVASLLSVVHTDQASATGQQPASSLRKVITGESTRLSTKDVDVLRIRFEAGARTYWHTHDFPQLLLVEEGKGRFQQAGGKIVELRAGETLYAPAHVPHWHGAAPDSAATLLTVYPHGVKLNLLNEVTDKEYRGNSLTRQP